MSENGSQPSFLPPTPLYIHLYFS